ncbi:MAG: hypothetical protein ACK5IJ_08705 [Mangrovibacterium sp.]
MPYRRLPNTDKARLRAIENALSKHKVIPSHELAFSYLTLLELQSIYPTLSAANSKLNRAKETQFNKSKSYAVIFRNAKLYVSHFIQVLNFAIARGEIKEEVRDFYGLKKNSPLLTKEEQLSKWGRKIIDGDAKRIASGGMPFYNPTIALVRAHFEQFETAYANRKTLQKQTGDASGEMVNLRIKVDAIITKLWNEIEAHFDHLPEEIKRTESTKYGISYVYRPKERARLIAAANQRKISFE